jgi:hypothetical protein
MTPVQDEVKAATWTYVYGYPLVYNMEEIAKFPAGTTQLVDGKTPYNQFGFARNLMTPETKFVSPNNDTLYVIAPCDVGQGPLVLHVPDTGGRYYVLQFIDAWTNNFAYVGRRATGTDEARFLLASGSYDGPVPEGMQAVTAPTALFVIGGRIQVDGPEDLAAARALQDQFTLTPLAMDQGAQAPSPVVGVPEPDPRVREDLKWWETFRVALAAFPPPAADAPYLQAAAHFGLTAAESPYVDPDPALAELLVQGQRQGEAMIEQLSKTTLEIVDGWSTALHAFDYNLDYFGPGTIDDPGWKIADRDKAYVTRAVAARLGLWGNHGYEAIYCLLWQDEHGDELDGSRAYELTLSPPPPVQAFWSLTMYDEPDYYLVDNPINRYSIGDRTPGLQTAADGSVTIYMQRSSPGEGKESNWLPAPAGRFRPVLRCYVPGDALLSDQYKLPKVRRVD